MNIQSAPDFQRKVSPKKVWSTPEVLFIGINGGSDPANNEAIFSDGMGGPAWSGVETAFNQYLHS